MSGRTTRVSITLPAALVARVREEAGHHGVTVREFVTEAAHGALAERLCRHASRVSEPPAPAEPTEDWSPGRCLPSAENCLHEGA
jgi:hypothetical protein